MKLCAPVDTIAIMCSGGVAQAIYFWIKDGMKKDPDILADEIGATISAMLGNCEI